MADADPAGTGLGSQLREAREARGLSRSALALLAGCTRQYIEMLESGDRQHPSAGLLAALAAALALSDKARSRLFSTMGVAPPTAAPVASRQTDALAAAFARAQPYPAFVVDACWGLLDWNALGPATFEVYPARLPVEGSNLLRLVFDRQFRSRALNWDEAAPALVARFKRETRIVAHDAAFQRTLRDLRTISGFSSLYRAARVEADSAAPCWVCSTDGSARCGWHG